MKRFIPLLPAIVLLGCAYAEPKQTPVPEAMYDTIECPELLETGKHIEDKAVSLIDDNEPLAIALKQIALSYYTVYTIGCIDKDSAEYNTIRDYVATQQKVIYDLKASEAEAYECKNGIGI